MKNQETGEFKPVQTALANSIGVLIGDNAVSYFTGESVTSLMQNYRIETAVPRDIAIGVVMAGVEYIYHRYKSGQEPLNRAS
jgi:hypothetical protein